MVRPEMLAIEGERAALEWNARHIFDRRRRFPRIQPRNAPILIPLLRPAQDKDASIDKNMTANLSADRDLAQNISIRIEFQDPMLIPLAKVKVGPVVTDVGAGELRTRHPLVLGKSTAHNISAKISIIIRAFAEGELQRLAR